jgi:malate dehydrogenase
VGNPCNTNCLIAMNNAREVPRDRWYAMTRLDENRAKTQLAQKAGVDVTAVERVTIWGNHSATQYPDYTNARINGKPAAETISDTAWLQGEFISTVQQRGAAIIKARGASSAGSAANAIIGSVVRATTPVQGDDWHSLAVVSDGSYGVPEGLICSFPTRFNGTNVEIVQGVELDEFSRQKVDASVAELQEEKSMVQELLP